jgi:hypothetical protein
MKTFAQLPPAIQNAFKASGCFDASDFSRMKFKTTAKPGYNGIWIAPELCYDFRVSNYSLHTINLKAVSKIDVGPAMATAYVKAAPALSAWLVIDGSWGDTPNQIYECV